MHSSLLMYTPAGILRIRAELCYKATCPVERQCSPDMVGPELSLRLVPPGAGGVRRDIILHLVPARVVEAHVLCLP